VDVGDLEADVTDTEIVDLPAGVARLRGRIGILEQFEV
jgi:hypothetical protein